MADNLLSQRKQEPGRQIPGAQALRNDAADVPRRLLMLENVEVSCVCVFVSRGHMTSSHVESSLQPRVDRLGRIGRPLAA